MPPTRILGRRRRTGIAYRLGALYSLLPGDRDRALELLSLAATGRRTDHNVRNANLYLSVLFEGESQWHVDWYRRKAIECSRNEESVDKDLAMIRRFYETVRRRGAAPN